MRRSHTTSESPAADGGIRGFALRILRRCTSVLPSPLPWRRFSISGCAAGTAGHWSARGLPFVKVSCWLPIAVLLAQLLCRRPSIRRSALSCSRWVCSPIDGVTVSCCCVPLCAERRHVRWPCENGEAAGYEPATSLGPCVPSRGTHRRMRICPLLIQLCVGPPVRGGVLVVPASSAVHVTAGSPPYGR